MDPEIKEILQVALGSTLVGFGIGTTLYGITCMQVYLYYRNYSKDLLYIKLIVFTLWILDTLGTIFIAHTLYSYLIPYVGVQDVACVIPWSYAVQSETVDIITLITQCFFAWQIWKVGKNAVVSCVIVGLSISAWALDIEVVVSMFRDNSGLTLANPVVLIAGTTVQGIDALCDIIITASFIYYLRTFKNGVKPTEKLVDNLILYAVSRGILTVVTQLVFVSLDAAIPGRLYWLPFQQAVGKLYVNSVLASLNSRKSENVPTTVVNVTDPASASASASASAMPRRRSFAWGDHMRSSRSRSRLGVCNTTILPMSFSPNPNTNSNSKTMLRTMISVNTSELKSYTYASTDMDMDVGMGMGKDSMDMDMGMGMDMDMGMGVDIDMEKGMGAASTASTASTASKEEEKSQSQNQSQRSPSSPSSIYSQPSTST